MDGQLGSYLISSSQNTLCPQSLIHRQLGSYLILHLSTYTKKCNKGDTINPNIADLWDKIFRQILIFLSD